ncbi:MAG: putative transcriptional regulator [Haloquadratum sp. J07HQX50]|nr:MAG: putative transcriptional regulator [Haloquadratum sp. J07HQX50]
MASDDNPTEPAEKQEDTDDTTGPRARLERETSRAVAEFDEGIVDVLAWLLDTETRARIYVNLRQTPRMTSEEIAEATGLYPSTVREALAELAEDGTVDRTKRVSEGAGNNPYEYTAIAQSELIREVISDVQSELNTIFNLDSQLQDSTRECEEDGGPVTILLDSSDSPQSDDSDQ